MLLPVPLRSEARLESLPWMTLVLIGLCLVGAMLTAGSSTTEAELQETELERLARWELDKLAAEDPALRHALDQEASALALLARDGGWRAHMTDERARERLESYLADYEALRREQPFHRFGFVPAEIDFVRLISHQFLHADILHLGFNMLFLWVVGSVMEATWGAWRFLLFYLSGGIAAALCHAAAHAQSLEPAIGASGAIAAVMGAFALRHPKLKLEVALVLMATLAPRVSVVSVPAWLFFGSWLAGQLAWLLLSSSAALGVAFEAHVGGFLWGAALVALVAWHQRPGRAS